MRLAQFFFGFMLAGVLVLPATGFSAPAPAVTSAPLDLEAQQLDVNQADGRAVFTGQVRVTQGPLVLTTDKLIVRYNRQGDDGSGVKDIQAEGNVTLVQAAQTITAQAAQYALAQEQIILTGQVTLVQGDTVLRGARLVYDLKTGRAQMQGTTNQRVRARLSPAGGL